jgi:hypothetical protein
MPPGFQTGLLAQSGAPQLCGEALALSQGGLKGQGREVSEGWMLEHADLEGAFGSKFAGLTATGNPLIKNTGAR